MRQKVQGWPLAFDSAIAGTGRRPQGADLALNGAKGLVC